MPVPGVRSRREPAERYTRRVIGRHLGSYVVRRKLGEGGMGVVYVGVHTQLGQEVALKLLLPEVSQNPEIVARFFNEARAASRINHPGIVRILDVGQAPDGSAFFVMELLAGESLAARMRRGPMPVAKACLIVRQVAGGLAAAHRTGIVHRDLKPDNIFLAPDPDVAGGERAKILDFGIAKLTADAQNLSTTRTGTLLGTPYYMSPEQCRGARDVDWRADIYALGCILYELLTGRRPFDGEGLGEILGKHQFVAPAPPRAIVPSLPPELEAVTLRALAKNPSDRQQSMDELAEALAPFAQPSAVIPAGAPAPTWNAPARTAVSAPRPSRRIWIAASAVVVAAAGVVAALVMRDGGPSVPTRDEGPPSAPAGAPDRKTAGTPDRMQAGAPDRKQAEPEPEHLQGAAVATPDAAPLAIAPAVAESPGAEPPPWAEPKLPAYAAAAIIAEWKKAENRATCAALAFADLGEAEGAVPRRASFSGGWAVAWDKKGSPGKSASGGGCDTCGRSVIGVAGAGVEAEGTNFGLWENQMQFSDGSHAGYGRAKYGGGPGSYLAYLTVAGQGCLYNIWTELGKEHMELLLRSLRYVTRAP